MKLLLKINSVSKLIFILLSSLIMSSCVYFNTFYNAKTSLLNAKKIINLSDFRDTDLSPQAKALLDESINNSKIVIEKYPESKYVEEAHYIIATSLYLKQDYKGSLKNFNVLTNKFLNGRYSNESIVWMALCEASLNNFSSGDSILNDIINKNKIGRYEKYLMNIYYAHRSIHYEQVDSAYYYYEKSLKKASNTNQKIKILNKMIQTAVTYNDYNNIVDLLDRIYPYLPTEKAKKEIKLLSLEYYKMDKNYDFLLVEIQDLLNQSVYNDKRLFLLIELAKAYYELNDYSASESILYEVTESYSKKNETAEAYYFLGQISLKRNFNYSLAKEYFDKSNQEKKSSKYAKKSKSFISKIESYENSLLQLDSALVIRPDSMDIQISADSLLFDLAQSYYFEFSRSDSSISRHKQLINLFPASIYYPKSLFVLSVIDSVNQEWISKLDSDFPDFNNKKSSVSNSTGIIYSNEFDEVLDLLELELYDEAYAKLINLYTKINNPELLYYLGYINEVYREDIKEMLYYYIKYYNEGESLDNFDIVKDKLGNYYIQIAHDIINKNFKFKIDECYDYAVSRYDIISKDKDININTINAFWLMYDYCLRDANHYLESNKDEIIKFLENINISYNKLIGHSGGPGGSAVFNLPSKRGWSHNRNVYKEIKSEAQREISLKISQTALLQIKDVKIDSTIGQSFYSFFEQDVADSLVDNNRLLTSSFRILIESTEDSLIVDSSLVMADEYLNFFYEKIIDKTVDYMEINNLSKDLKIEYESKINIFTKYLNEFNNIITREESLEENYEEEKDTDDKLDEKYFERLNIDGMDLDKLKLFKN